MFRRDKVEWAPRQAPNATLFTGGNLPAEPPASFGQVAADNLTVPERFAAATKAYLALLDTITDDLEDRLQQIRANRASVAATLALHYPEGKENGERTEPPSVWRDSPAGPYRVG